MNRKKVLLADDVELFLELEKTFFQRKEIDLVIARTGRQAVDLAKKEMPDLIFMDLYMPEMNGSDACRELKNDASTSAIPVVMVTQGGREEEIRECRDAGCDEILFKPINRHLFMATARRFLDIHDRTNARIEAHLKVQLETSGRKQTDYCLNVSAGGIYLATAKPDRYEGQVELMFNLPDREVPVQCQGRVAWINGPDDLKKPSLPSGMGVQFVGLTALDREAIVEFIKQECLTPSW